MKKLLAAFAIAPMLTAAPAVADYHYRACMEFCLKEREFAHCNNICREQAGKSQIPIPEVLKGRDCSTLRLKAEALSHYIWKTYGPKLMSTAGFPVEDDETAFEVGFSQYEGEWEFRGGDGTRCCLHCGGIVKITDDCRVSGFEKLNCEFEELE